MRYIFCDFDGVLNYIGSPESIEPYLVTLLNRLIRWTGAKVVISSAWRQGRTIKELQEILEEGGFEGEVVGRTRSDHTGKRDSRPAQITDWIETGRKLYGLDIDSFVILDDYEMDILNPLSILTDPSRGLSYNDIVKARKILEEPPLLTGG